MSSFPAGASAIATSSNVLGGLPPRPMIRTRSQAARISGFDEYNTCITSRDSQTSAPPPASIVAGVITSIVQVNAKVVEGQEKPKALETQDLIWLGCTSVVCRCGLSSPKTTSVRGALIVTSLEKAEDECKFILAICVQLQCLQHIHCWPTSDRACEQGSLVMQWCMNH